MKNEVVINEPESNRDKVPRKGKPKKSKRGSRKGRRHREEIHTEFADCLTVQQQQELKNTVKLLSEPEKGILDLNSTAELQQRFAEVSLDYNEDTRMEYLNIYLNVKKQLSFYLSGIMIEESMLDTAQPMRRRKYVLSLADVRIMLGVKVGESLVPLPGSLPELIREGLDSLPDVCIRIKELGAEFTCWESIYVTSDYTPSYLAMKENANTLARFTTICQSQSLVPIISIIFQPCAEQPLYLYDAYRAMQEVLTVVVKTLLEHHAYLEGLIFLVSVVNPGIPKASHLDAERAARATLKALNDCLPPAIGAVMITSGNSLDLITTALNEMNRCPGKRPYPITFCFGRVIHDRVVENWAGKPKNVEAVQELVVKRAKLCSASSMGQNPSRDKNVFISNYSVY